MPTPRPYPYVWVFWLTRLLAGEAYAKQTEQEYAEQVKVRLERQPARRAKELGFELRMVEPALETVVMPDGEVLTVTFSGVTVNARDARPTP